MEGPQKSDSSATEGATPLVEFPPLTKEDLIEIDRLYAELLKKFWHGKISGFESYTGVEEAIGMGNEFFNSGVTWRQFLYALAMTRNSLIREIGEAEFDVLKFNAKTLIENQIMAGMKILDLGSGPKPVFARCCRAMGADVWTVDKESDFKNRRSLLSRELWDLEDRKHIKLELTDINMGQRAVFFIQKKSKGNFNLVTEANLISGGLENGRVIAMPLLRKGGIYRGFGPRTDPKPQLKE